MARTLTLAPQLCVCALSHKRLDLLNTTLTAIVQHLELVETGLPYELVWVDNGSDEAERHALHRRFSFEKVLFLGTNYGMAYGFNTLFFRLCSAPYFLTLEEDWEWLPSRGVHVAPEVVSYETVGQTALRDAIAVLRHDTSLSGVFHGRTRWTSSSLEGHGDEHRGGLRPNRRRVRVPRCMLPMALRRSKTLAVPPTAMAAAVAVPAVAIEMCLRPLDRASSMPRIAWIRVPHTFGAHTRMARASMIGIA